jgi:hypothetical protein
VHLHKLSKIELRLLKYFYLTNENILKGEDGVALLLDLGTHGLGVGDTVVLFIKIIKIMKNIR